MNGPRSVLWLSSNLKSIYLGHLSCPILKSIRSCLLFTVAPYAVSLVLIRVDSGIQQPIFYVSKSLHKVEVRYLPLEKAILVVMHAT